MATIFILEFTAEKHMRVTVDSDDILDGENIYDAAERLASESLFGSAPLPKNVAVESDWVVQPEEIREAT